MIHKWKAYLALVHVKTFFERDCGWKETPQMYPYTFQRWLSVNIVYVLGYELLQATYALQLLDGYCAIRERGVRWLVEVLYASVYLFRASVYFTLYVHMQDVGCAGPHELECMHLWHTIPTLTLRGQYTAGHIQYVYTGYDMQWPEAVHAHQTQNLENYNLNSVWDFRGHWWMYTMWKQIHDFSD